MIISRASRTSTCSNCRSLLLRTFISLADLPRQAYLPPSRKASGPPVYKFSQSYSTAIDHNNLTKSPDNPTVEDEIEHQDGTGDVNIATELETKETVPWYLQVETTKKTPESLLERQRIPDLPANPPEILEPLLQQLSIDLGLDYLTIIDLRKLEPPAALGANLLMIISTARSERHLHTSADRLCRWLRSNYKLRPDADGLLGRDERKLKMRRKARRAKLLGGGVTDDDGDDGIRTGWICVNAGTVEMGRDPEVAGDSVQGKFVGFGQRMDGVKIVVQLLTEEKREEIDLESLWNGVLQRAETPGQLDGDTHEMLDDSTDPRW